jgi:CheY-like chemotaxis protein
VDPLKILLVDDSKSARYALRLQLQRHGVLVDTAESAEAALERIAEAPPDAVLMDHTMPGMNGFEALEIIKSDLSTAHIPVVMCTSHDDPVYSGQAVKRGALSVLTKAAAADKLPQVLEQIRAALAARSDIHGAPTAAPAEHPEPAAPPGPTRAEVEEWVEVHLGQRLGDAIEPHLARIVTQLRQLIAEQVEMAVDSLPPPPAPPPPPVAIAPPPPVVMPVAAPAPPPIDMDQLRENIVPAAVRRHFDAERDHILQLMQQCVQEAHAGQVDIEDTVLKIQQGVDATVTAQATQTARREAEAAVHAVLAQDRETLDALRRGLNLSYGLAAAALLVALGAIAAVFLL